MGAALLVLILVQAVSVGCGWAANGGNGGAAGMPGTPGDGVGGVVGGGGAGGAAGSGAGENGGAGANAVGLGNGGGGGGGGAYGNGAGTAVLDNSDTLTGGNGGAGGTGVTIPSSSGAAGASGASDQGGQGATWTTNDTGANGGSGAGGAGALVTGSDSQNTNSGALQGGIGGTATGTGGAGGGGSGVIFTGSNNMFLNSGAVKGGTGGYRVQGPGGGGGNGITGSNLTVTNTGLISAGAGGNVVNGSGGNGGVGILGNAVTVENSGSIIGGNGGDTTNTSRAGAGSAAISGNDLIVTNTNSGRIIGGDGGSNTSPTVQSFAGAGISGSNMTIINAGEISGGQIFNGGTTNAISFTGGTNSLELQAGWSINGDVSGSGTNTLILGGDVTLDSAAGATVFDMSKIGVQSTYQYRNLSVFQKTGDSTWTLRGTTSTSTPWTILQGTLQISADGNLGSASSTLTLANGATLATTADITSTRAVTLDTGGGTFDVAPGTTLALNGVISGAGSLTKEGAGTLTLSNASNGYSDGTTITDGTLVATRGGVLGSGVVDNSGALQLDFGTASTLANILSGAGSLTKTGMGVATLSANGSSQGAVAVEAGTLLFSETGSFTAASYTTQSGASTTLNGTAQLKVTGAFTQDTGSTLNVVIGANDPAIMAGTATLGGTLNIAGYGGTTYTAIHTTGAATNGISGNFDQVTIGGATTSVDYLTVIGAVIGERSADGNDYNIGVGLTWNAGPPNAHGTFTLTDASEAFEVGVALTNQTGLFNSGWDGQSLTKEGAGTLTLSAANTYTGATTVNGGALAIASTGSITSDVTNNATFENAGTVAASVTNNAGATFTQTSGSVSGGVTNSGTVNAYGGALNGAIANNAGSFNIGGTVTSDNVFNNAAGAALTVSGSSNYTLDGMLTNGGAITVATGGSLTANGGVLNSASGVITNNGTITDDLNNAGLVTNNLAYNANVASNTGTIVNTAGATWTGNFNTAGIVGNGGTIDGSLTQTAGTTTNTGAITGIVTVSGGLFTGTGAGGAMTVANGAIFQPGNGTPGSSATVNGNLTLQAGATYAVNVNPATSSFAIVNGTATLGGATVSADFTPGSYVMKRYTILTATAGVNGTFDPLINTNNLPGGFQTGLSYDPTNAYLNLRMNFGADLNINQQNVANAVTGFFDRTGGIPVKFGALTPAGLTQVSGELATATQQTTFEAMTQFMGVMSDTAGAGRGEDACSQPSLGPYRKAPVKVPLADCFVSRWNVWAAGYGASRNTDGNTVAGSNNTTGRVYGVAAGADHRVSPDTLLGFALGGGGTNFGLANGLGSGRSDLFQVGVYARRDIGAAYLSGALAYGWQEITTDRAVTVAGIDRLRANFNANAYSGRIEGGWRFATEWGGLTPYAAGQFATFDLLDYAEQALVGSNVFALNYAGKSVTTSRSELGLRSDKSFALADGGLVLRSRFAWGHNFNDERSITAMFQSLPGSSFVVNGASIGRDAALTTVSAEMNWRNGWSAGLTFDGEFSDTSRNYTGKGVIRYRW